MTREEMMAKGLTPNETKHNGNRRAFFHDYNRPGTYMITMVTEGRKRLLATSRDMFVANKERLITLIYIVQLWVLWFFRKR